MFRKPLLMTGAGAVAATVLAGAVCAQTTSAGRYTMHKAEDGFVRLDTQTGAMSLCRKSDDAWACTPMADTKGGGRAEIAELRRENQRLREEVKRLDGLLDNGVPQAEDPSDPPRPGGTKKPGMRLPSEKEVDQALDYFENMLRKFQDRLKRLERKEETPETKPL